jgi:hypothetical protein
VKRYLYCILLLLLVLALGACGGNDGGATQDSGGTGSSGDDVAEIEDADTLPGETATTEEPGAGASTAEQPSPGVDDDAARAEVENRLAGLNIPLPEGARLMSIDDNRPNDLEVTYEVPGMEPARVLAFYQERLPGEGYQIDDQDDDEIEFSGNGQSGEIEVDSRSGGTRLKIDIETR